MIENSTRPEVPANVDLKTKIEFLRVATMIGQKIDVIWVTFITTYVTLFGFALFYSGIIKNVYFIFIVFATATFTWINGRSLWHHYRLQNEMGAIFIELNKEFPSLEDQMALYHQPRSEYTLVFTHISGFLIYLIFVFEKFFFIDPV